MSSKAEEFKRKVEKLQRHIDDAKSTSSPKPGEKMVIPYFGILAGSVPIVTALTLWFAHPGIVMEEDKDSGEEKRSMKKVVFWTVVATIVVWVAMFLGSYCLGKNPVLLLTGKK